MLQKFLFTSILLLGLSLGTHVWSLEELLVKGKITQTPFINQNGKKIPDIFDYSFNFGKEDYHIKLITSRVSEKEIQKYLNKNITAKIIKREGLWDTKDDEEAQSRTGPYVEILEITP